MPDLMYQWRKQVNLIKLGELSDKELLKVLKEVFPYLKSTKNEYEGLMENYVVKRFLEITEKKEKLEAIVDLVESKYEDIVRSTCTHDLWYLLGSETDRLDEKKHWLCKCLVCGYQTEALNHYFRTPVIMNGRYAIKNGGYEVVAEKNSPAYDEAQQDYRVLLDKYNLYFEKRKEKYDQEVNNNLILEDDVLNYSSKPVVKKMAKKYRNANKNS